LRGNLDTLRVIREAHVLQADAARCDWPPPPAGERETDPPRYGLIFMDPPYRLLAGPTPDPAVRTLLRRLATSPLIAPDALIVVRHELQPAGGPALSPLIEIDRRDVGTMT